MQYDYIVFLGDRQLCQAEGLEGIKAGIQASNMQTISHRLVGACVRTGSKDAFVIAEMLGVKQGAGIHSMADKGWMEVSL